MITEGFFKNTIKKIELKTAKKIFDKKKSPKSIFGKTIYNPRKDEQIDSYNQIVRRHGLDQNIRGKENEVVQKNN